MRSKRFLEIQKLRETKKEYDLKTAISFLKEMSCTKFVETAEAHFRLNIDPKYNDQQLRATVSFPGFSHDNIIIGSPPLLMLRLISYLSSDPLSYR